MRSLVAETAQDVEVSLFDPEGRLFVVSVYLPAPAVSGMEDE